MRLDLYMIETAQTAKEQGSLLDEARVKLLDGGILSRLEKNGVLHALQVLIENAVGKAKQILKAAGEPVPISAYDAFASLERLSIISTADLPTWNASVGLRNRIVHEYMNIDIERVLDLVRAEQYRFVVDFLLLPINDGIVKSRV